MKSNKSRNEKSNKSATVAIVQREQLQLVKTEAELKAMIENINAQLNQLLVEELQLKSNAIAHRSQTDVKPIAPSVLPAAPVDWNTASQTQSQSTDSIVQVNRQPLDLNAVPTTARFDEFLMKYVEVEEDDEDD